MLVTSDHGMGCDGMHGGVLPQEREVPLWVLGQRFSHKPDVQVRQTELCGTMAELLGVPHDKPLCTGLLAATSKAEYCHATIKAPRSGNVGFMTAGFDAAAVFAGTAGLDICQQCAD